MMVLVIDKEVFMMVLGEIDCKSYCRRTWTRGLLSLHGGVGDGRGGRDNLAIGDLLPTRGDPQRGRVPRHDAGGVGKNLRGDQ